MTTNTEETQNDAAKRKQPFWRNMLSVMQASFGVQSKKNQERDFANGSIGSFVVAALIFTTLFVLTLVVVVKSVLP